MRSRTLNLIEAAYGVLSEYNPMTLRQVYYQLVSKHVIDNNRNEYQRLSNALVKGRKEGFIPWEWLEDRTRKPKVPNARDNLYDFIKSVKRSYKRDIWASQPCYTVVWVEKDALSGIFESITTEYGVPLIVGKGYNSWSIKKDVTAMIKDYNKPTVILYFGDFDPSGEDICRDLRDSISYFGIVPDVQKVALTAGDVIEYNLPPDFAKKSDSRSKVFIKKFGDMAVELDALPLPVLQNKIREAIESNLDCLNLK